MRRTKCTGPQGAELLAAMVSMLVKARRERGELAALLGASPYAVGRHIRILRQEGLVRLDGHSDKPTKGRPADVYEWAPE